jgi:basic membrane lipoprotein Med (substrate-binding protein (PBP1-ABC) superfamily)/signal transduction histidine kinase
VTRRIVLTLLALTATVLLGAVVPLALQAVAHERDAFKNSAEATARSVAVIAEDKLGDHAADPALQAAVRSAARQEDELLLLNAKGQVVVWHGSPHDGWRAVAAEAAQSGDPASKLTKDRVIVVEPVWNDGKFNGNPIGTIVLERPTGPLNQNIENLWLYLAALSGGAMAAAALIAIYFARWIGKPLARLDTAARRIADGELAVRAGTGSGPPEVRRMAATFNMMAGRLETLVHGHRAMLADASHQLRTPLTALRLRLDLLAAESGPTDAAELAGAQEEIARLSRLVDGLLATARAESVTEQLENIDVVAAVAERVAAWQPVADGHGVKLVVETPHPRDDGKGGGRPLVALGAGHLEQILDNLLDNAIDAIGDGSGSVRVSVATSADGTTLTIADDGPGMTPQERSRAFLRFTTGHPGGTGLGLAIVHRLVTANGGTIRLADTPGGGLTVVLEFPGTALYEGTNPAGWPAQVLGRSLAIRPRPVAIVQRGGRSVGEPLPSRYGQVLPFGQSGSGGSPVMPGLRQPGPVEETVRHTAFITAAAAAATSLLLAACGSSSSSASSSSTTSSAAASATASSTGGAAASGKFLGCMVTDVGGINDKSFNQSAWEGMQEAAAANPNITVKYLPSTTLSDYVPNINTFIGEKCGIIVTVGFAMGPSTQTAAQKNPTQDFAIVDNAYSPIIKNIDALVFNTVQDGFLGGYLAAGMTKTGKVATFGGAQYPTVTIYMDGFWDGVQYYNSKHGTHVQVLGWNESTQKGSFTGDFTNQTKGQTVTQTFISEGADIIFPVAGFEGLGAAKAVQNADNAGGHVNMLWVDTDGCISAVQYCKYFISSVTKGIQSAVKAAVLSAQAGSFKGGNYIGTLSNGGVPLSPFHDFVSKVPASLQTELKTIQAGIENGTIKTPTKSPVS